MSCEACGALVARDVRTGAVMDAEPVLGGDIIYFRGKLFRLNEGDASKRRYVEHECGARKP